MSTDQSTSGAPNQNASGDDEGKKDVVAYDTYRKAIGEVKATKAKLAEYEAMIETERQAKLSEQGKYKEQAEDLMKKLSEKDLQIKKTVQTFGRKVFEQETKQIALQLGARTEAVDDILKVGDFSDVEIDENFSINKEQLKMKVEELAKAKPYFFANSPSKINDVVPSGKSQGSTSDLSKLSREEILALLKNAKD